MSESASDKPGRSKTRPQKRAERSEQAVPVNKTLEIRKVARQMVAVGKPPRPIEIVAQLKARGIDITSAHVSTALANTDFAFRRNRPDWERPQVVFPDPTLALGQVSIDDVIKARKFVVDLGTIEKAMAALVALKQFGGEAKTGPRPVSDVGEIVSLEEPDRSPPDDTKGRRMRKVV
jgi:hypothetical protein